MLRAHNEEATIEQSIRSLVEHLTIPYEVVVILHLCTDRSEEIVTSLAATYNTIRILKYTIPISRAGYENLATDVNSPHSIATYYNWCKAQCRCNWIFKWDADFIATPGLLAYLNGRVWSASDPPENIRIVACNNDMSNSEIYLSSAIISYVKYMFWETPMFKKDTSETIAPNDVIIDHYSPLKNIKTYWKTHIPWYDTEYSDEARLVKSRMEQLIKDFGIPPPGMARASDPACDSYFFAIKRANPSYVNISK